MSYRKLTINTLRVNIKSLAAEAKIIKQEIKKTPDQTIKNSLSCHRKTNLREEARVAHLSLACIRGVPYEVVESKAKTKPNFYKISKKIEKHLSFYYPEWTDKKELLEKTKIWLEKAGQYWNSSV